ncbi:MAG TPA: helix-hairpin-helix domain-containing protein [Chitinispirillaceae bacterium]|nr:helix-hairpin-helix domain-containing protein [Chitinispirillaceae bacterium]
MEHEKINLNTASYEDIRHLRMVGDARAHFILDHRPYKNWQDFQDKVPGISEGLVDDIKQSGGTID